MLGKVILLCLLGTCLLTFYGHGALADERYAFDKDHTSISFSVSRFGIFEESGEFGNYDGNFVFNPQAPDKDAIAITLYSASIAAADPDMTDELQGNHFFNAAQFPSIRFTSTDIRLIDSDHAQITGELTLLDITKPVTFDAQFTQKYFSPDIGRYVVNFSAACVIKRSDFGMDYLIPFIGDDVRLHIQVRGIEEKN